MVFICREAYLRAMKAARKKIHRSCFYSSRNVILSPLSSKTKDKEIEMHIPVLGAPSALEMTDKAMLALAEGQSDRTCSCDNCEWSGPESSLGTPLEETPDLAIRLDPGSVVPAGECPECGCFAYIVED